MSVNSYTPVFFRGGYNLRKTQWNPSNQQQTGENMEPGIIRLNNAAIRQAIKTALRDLLPED
jgi:hypothetical protein|nr:MAG TPA: hypothetical protein [Caudoviricetes sp.]